MKNYMTDLHEFTHTIILLFVCICSVNSQNGIQNQGGAATNGIGHAGVTLDDISAMYTNQAGTAFMDGWAVDVSVDQRFDIPELSTFSFAAATSLDIGTIGVTVGQYGFDALSEQKIGLSYARLLTSKLSVSGQANMLGFEIADFGNTYAFTVELGIYTQLSNKIHLAAHVFNPTSTKLNSNEELDTRMKIGVKYIPSDRVTIYSEAEKIIDRDLQMKFGLDYEVINDLDIMAGSNLTIQSFHVGFKYRIQNQFTLAAAFSYNNNLLGNSPGVSAQYWSRVME